MGTTLSSTMIISSFVLLFAGSAAAQFLVISAEQLQDRMQQGKRPVIIDVRPAEEYRSGHVPGAINIPAERMTADRRRLPKDKSVPLVFYCRGAG